MTLETRFQFLNLWDEVDSECVVRDAERTTVSLGCSQKLNHGKYTPVVLPTETRKLES